MASATAGNGGPLEAQELGKSTRRREELASLLFGLLAALRRKKPEQARLSLFAAVLDTIQLIPFICLPTISSWGQPGLTAFSDVVAKFRLAGIVTPYGYGAFRAAYFSVTGVTLAVLLLCSVSLFSAWRGSAQSNWYVRLVRRSLLFLCQALFLSALELVWLPWRCDYWNGSMLLDFPSVPCWGGENAPLAVVGVFLGLLLVALSLLTTMVQFDPNPTTVQPQAIANPNVPLLGVAVRSLLIVAAISLFYIPFWLAIFIAGALGYWALQHIGEVPYYDYGANVLRSAVLFALAFGGAWQAAVELFHRPDVPQLVYGLPIAVALGGMVGWMVCSRYLTAMDASSPAVTRQHPDGREFTMLFKFEDATQPEVCCRVLREIGATPERMDRCQAVWAAALAQFGEHPYVLVSHASFLLAYGVDIPKANHTMERARRLRTSVAQRYALYLFDQEGQRRRNRSSAGDSSMDLTTYVEFQASMKVVSKAHRRVLFEVRKFWRLVHAEERIAVNLPPPPSSSNGDGASSSSGLRRNAGRGQTQAAGQGGTGLALALASPGGAAAAGGRRSSLPTANGGSATSLLGPGTGAAPGSSSGRLRGAVAAGSSAAGPSTPGGPGSAPGPSTPGNSRLRAWESAGAGAPGASNASYSSRVSVSSGRKQPGGGQGFDSSRSLGGTSQHSQYSQVSRGSGGGRGKNGAASASASASTALTPASRARMLATAGYPSWLARGGAHYMSPTLVALLARAGADASAGAGLRPSVVARLARCCVRIDRLAEEARRTYVAMLQRYPRSPKLLRAFAKFLLDINQNQREASKCNAEAERLEEGAAEEGEKGGEGGAFKASSMVDDSVDALVVISSNGIITSINANCRRMFGYSEAELIGSKVQKLMPILHAQNHDDYLRAYLTTGVAKVIGIPRRLFGRHRDGYTFPIDLAVSRVETPQGLTFAGIIHALPEEEAVAHVDIDPRGRILNVNRPFCRLFGWSLKEVIGSNIKNFMPREYAKHHDSYLAKYDASHSKAVNVKGRRLQGLHRNGMVMPVAVEIEAYPGARMTVFSGRITELANVAGVLTINERGIVLSATKACLDLFGYSAQSELVGRNVTRIMPEPYRTFHGQYLERYLRGEGGRIVGATAGRFITAQHADGSTFNILLKIRELAAGSTVGASSGSRSKSSSSGGASRSGSSGPAKGGKGSGRMFEAEITLAEAGIRRDEKTRAGARGGGGGGDDDELGPGAEAGGVIADEGDTGEVDPLLGRVSINEEGKILFANGTICDMFGWREETLRGQNIKVLMPPSIAVHHDGYLSKHAETGENVVVGTVGRHLIGQTSKGELLPISLTVEEETVGGRSTYHGNIRALGDIEGLLIADMEGKILNVNSGVCYLFGYRPAELEGRNVTRLMPRRYRRAHPASLRRFKEARVSRFTNTRQVVPAVHSDGTVISIQLEATCIKHAEYGECLAARIVMASFTPEEAEKLAQDAVNHTRKTDMTGSSEDDGGHHDDAADAAAAGAGAAAAAAGAGAGAGVEPRTPRAPPTAAELEELRIKDKEAPGTAAARTPGGKSGKDKASAAAAKLFAPEVPKAPRSGCAFANAVTEAVEEDRPLDLSIIPRVPAWHPPIPQRMLDMMAAASGSSPAAVAAGWGGAAPRDADAPRPATGDPSAASRSRTGDERSGGSGRSGAGGAGGAGANARSNMSDAASSTGGGRAGATSTGSGEKERPRRNSVTFAASVGEHEEEKERERARRLEKERAKAARAEAKAAAATPGDMSLRDRERALDAAGAAALHAHSGHPAHFHDSTASAGTNGSGGVAAGSSPTGRQGLLLSPASGSSSGPGAGTGTGAGARGSPMPHSFGAAGLLVPTGPGSAGMGMGAGANGHQHQGLLRAASFRTPPGLVPSASAVPVTMMHGGAGPNGGSAGGPSNILFGGAGAGAGAHGASASALVGGVHGVDAALAAVRQRVWDMKHGLPQPGDNKFIFSDSHGNALSFAKAAQLLGVVRPELEMGGAGDGPEPGDAHMEGVPGGWLPMSALGTRPGIVLPGRDPGAADWREAGLRPPQALKPDVDGFYGDGEGGPGAGGPGEGDGEGAYGIGAGSGVGAGGSAAPGSPTVDIPGAGAGAGNTSGRAFMEHGRGGAGAAAGAARVGGRAGGAGMGAGARSQGHRTAADGDIEADGEADSLGANPEHDRSVDGDDSASAPSRSAHGAGGASSRRGSVTQPSAHGPAGSSTPAGVLMGRPGPALGALTVQGFTLGALGTGMTVGAAGGAGAGAGAGGTGSFLLDQEDELIAMALSLPGAGTVTATTPPAAGGGSGGFAAGRLSSVSRRGLLGAPGTPVPASVASLGGSGGGGGGQSTLSFSAQAASSQVYGGSGLALGQRGAAEAGRADQDSDNESTQVSDANASALYGDLMMHPHSPPRTGAAGDVPVAFALPGAAGSPADAPSSVAGFALAAGRPQAGGQNKGSSASASASLGSASAAPPHVEAVHAYPSYGQAQAHGQGQAAWGAQSSGPHPLRLQAEAFLEFLGAGGGAGSAGSGEAGVSPAAPGLGAGFGFGAQPAAGSSSGGAGAAGGFAAVVGAARRASLAAAASAAAGAGSSPEADAALLALGLEDAMRGEAETVHTLAAYHNSVLERVIAAAPPPGTLAGMGAGGDGHGDEGEGEDEDGDAAAHGGAGGGGNIINHVLYDEDKDEPARIRNSASSTADQNDDRDDDGRSAHSGMGGGSAAGGSRSERGGDNTSVASGGSDGGGGGGRDRSADEKRRSKHRLRQLKRVRRNQHIRQTITAMRASTIVSAIVLLALCAIGFGVDRHLVAVYQSSLAGVVAANARAQAFQELPVRARQLQLALQAQDAASFYVASSVLSNAVAVGSQTHTSLYMDFGVPGTSSASVAVAAQYNTENIPVAVYVDTAEPPTYITQKVSFWQLGTLYLTNAELLTGLLPVLEGLLLRGNVTSASLSIASAAAAAAAAAAAVSGSSTSGYAGGSSVADSGILGASSSLVPAPWLPSVNASLRDAAPWRFVMDNEGVATAQALLAADLMLASSQWYGTRAERFQLALYIIEVLAVLLLLLGVMRPLYVRVQRERAHMFSLFAIIPHQITGGLSSMDVKMGSGDRSGGPGGDGDDDDDSDSSASFVDSEEEEERERETRARNARDRDKDRDVEAGKGKGAGGAGDEEGAHGKGSSSGDMDGESTPLLPGMEEEVGGSPEASATALAGHGAGTAGGGEDAEVAAALAALPAPIPGMVPLPTVEILSLDSVYGLPPFARDPATGALYVMAPASAVGGAGPAAGQGMDHMGEALVPLPVSPFSEAGALLGILRRVVADINAKQAHIVALTTQRGRLPPLSEAQAHAVREAAVASTGISPSDGGVAAVAAAAKAAAARITFTPVAPSHGHYGHHGHGHGHGHAHGHSHGHGHGSPSAVNGGGGRRASGAAGLVDHPFLVVDSSASGAGAHQAQAQQRRPSLVPPLQAVPASGSNSPAGFQQHGHGGGLPSPVAFASGRGSTAMSGAGTAGSLPLLAGHSSSGNVGPPALAVVASGSASGAENGDPSGRMPTDAGSVNSKTSKISNLLSGGGGAGAAAGTAAGAAGAGAGAGAGASVSWGRGASLASGGSANLNMTGSSHMLLPPRPSQAQAHMHAHAGNAGAIVLPPSVGGAGAYGSAAGYGGFPVGPSAGSGAAAGSSAASGAPRLSMYPQGGSAASQPAGASAVAASGTASGAPHWHRSTRVGHQPSRRTSRRGGHGTGGCCGALCSGVRGSCFWAVLLPVYGLWRIACFIAGVVAAALSCRRPLSTPRKVGLSVAGLLALLSANYGTLKALDASGGDGLLYAHLQARVCVLLTRARFLSQELVYAGSPLIAGVQPLPPPAPAVTSTSPDPAALAASLRALVSMTQMTQDVVVMGASATAALPAAGDGFLDASLLAAAGTGDLMPGPASYVPAGVAPTLDSAYASELLVAFGLEDDPAAAASLPAEPEYVALTTLPGGLFFTDVVTRSLIAPGCLRRGASVTLGSSGAAVQQQYTLTFPSLRVEMGAPLNESWPVLLPADPYACPPEYNPESARSQHGLDAVVRSVLAEAWSLANQSSGEGLVPWAQSYAFVQTVASLDAADGLDASGAAFLARARSVLGASHLASAIFFAAYIAVITLWYLLLLKPFVSLMVLETTRVANLLSFLPKNVDLEKLMTLHKLAMAAAAANAASLRSA